MHAGNADDELLIEAEQRIGLVLRDKWQLDRLLGVGGMGAVYAATHRNGSRGAVKVLHTALTLSREIRTRFLREGYAANQVNHSGVVQVIDDDEDQGVVFLVMELLEGETLEERWLRKGRRLPADEVLSVADQVLDVLAAAHDKGIVHRDLKPENLFLTKEGRIKVLDFGIARLRHASTSPRTRTGGTFGTPAFMPPEQALGHAELVDGKSDLWSLGATLFTLISGRLVHEGTTVNEQLLSAMTQPAPPLEMVAPCVSSELSALVDRALSREKGGRFEDALSMQQAVREAYDALPESFDSFDHLPTIIVRDDPRPPSDPPSPPESGRTHDATITQTVPSARPAAFSSLARHRVTLTAASAGFVVVAALSIFHESSPPPPPPALGAVSPPVPQPAREQIAQRPTARAPSSVPTSRAAREASPKALSVDDLPLDLDDESSQRARPVGGAPQALAPAMVHVAVGSAPPAALPPAVPVQPREVHLEELPPSPYDDPNPYEDPKAASSRRASTPPKSARPQDGNL